MSFLRRLLGGDSETAPASDEPPPTATELQEAEQSRERELLRADAARLDDELIQRQMRYADRSWTPPAQGGARRSDDEESAEDG
jgi:hypothetical protein